MADDIDKAQDAAAVNLDDALQAQRLRARTTVHLAGRGECLNPRCCEPFAANDNGRLFCGPACEAEHRRLKRA